VPEAGPATRARRGGEGGVEEMPAGHAGRGRGAFRAPSAMAARRHQDHRQGRAALQQCPARTRTAASTWPSALARHAAVLGRPCAAPHSAGCGRILGPRVAGSAPLRQPDPPDRRSARPISRGGRECAPFFPANPKRREHFRGRGWEGRKRASQERDQETACAEGAAILPPPLLLPSSLKKAPK